MKNNIQLHEVQDNIRTNYASLSKRLKQVAQYVLDNPQSIVFDTVATVAAKANVPPSTLIRFANAFGFDGFNEMKQLFREHLMENTPNYLERLHLSREINGEDEDSVENVLNIFTYANSKALQQLAAETKADDLQLAITLLQNANNIFIVGLKRSFSVACYFDYALKHFGYNSFVINGLGGMFDEQLGQVREGDVIVAISFAPYAKETLDILNATSKKGIKQIAITDSQISPLLSFSDVSFVIKEAQVKGFRSQSVTMTLVQTLAIGLATEKEKLLALENKV
ncbi:MurR/RpiR family transcriptional regulator [Pasteurellaceae bacterium LIM206]|nr:MurR/RpiR family transcriptional regulator [Pasteurellaceae bacterium LIM206]